MNPYFSLAVGGVEVPLFHPRQQRWDEHFRIDVESGELQGTTPTGRATIDCLDLNHPLQLLVRQLWVRLRLFPRSDRKAPIIVLASTAWKAFAIPLPAR